MLPADHMPYRIRKILSSSWQFFIVGVLWKSGEEIPGASQFVNTMQRKGKRCIFLTNNSTRSRTTVAQHAAKFGFQVKDTDFVTTAYLCGQYLNEEANFDRRKKIYVIGCDGIHEELRNAGFNTSFGLGVIIIALIVSH